MNKYEGLIKMAKAELGFLEKTSGKESQEYLDCLTRLAAAYEDNEQYDEAIETWKEVHASASKVLGENHRGAIATLSNLGACYLKAGRYSDAEIAIDKALNSAIKASDDDTFIASIANNLATCGVSLGKYDKAISILQKTFLVCVKRFGQSATMTLFTAKNLAECYALSGSDINLAIQMLESICLYIQNVSGTDNDDNAARQELLVGTEASLVTKYFSTNQHDKAMELLKKLLDNLTTDEKALTCLTAIADMCRQANCLKEAANVLGIAHAKYKETLGEEHPTTIWCMANLAVCCYDSRQNDKAAEFLNTAVPLAIKVLGPSHESTLAAQMTQALCLHEAGNTKAAIEILESIIQIARSTYGTQHKSFVSCAFNLGMCYFHCGQHYDKAISLLEEAIVSAKPMYGEHHRNHIAMLHTLAVCYHCLGRKDEAKATAEKVLAIVDKNPSALGVNETNRLKEILRELDG